MCPHTLGFKTEDAKFFAINLVAKVVVGISRHKGHKIGAVCKLMHYMTSLFEMVSGIHVIFIPKHSVVLMTSLAKLVIK